MATPSSAFATDVLPQERDHIRRAREATHGLDPKAVLAGLALSGGGIRSATFNLGILQAFAEAGRLRRFDYLSTVSGGGYIGGWLAAWIHRQGLDAVEKALGDSVAGKADGEPHEIRWLRAHSNYLTPRKGWLSIDTLWGASTFVRNLLVNQFLLIAIIVAALFGAAAGHTLLDEWSKWAPLGMASTGALLMLGPSAILFGFEMAHLRGQPPRPFIAPLACYFRGGSSPWWIAILTIAGAVLISYALPAPALWEGQTPATAEHLFYARVDLVALYGAPFALYWIVAALTARLAFGTTSDPDTTGNLIRPSGLWVIWIAVGTVVFAILQGLLVVFLNSIPADYHWLYSLVGPVLYIGALEVAVLVIILLGGRLLRGFAHDWLSRVAAVVITVSLPVVAVFFSWIVLVPAIDYLEGLQLTGATAVWLASTLAGVLGGRSAATDGHRNRKLELALAVTPYIFLLGMLALVVWAARGVMAWATWPHEPATVGFTDSRWLMELKANLFLLNDIPPVAWLWGLAAALFLALVAARRVDINLFSFHSYYRNRLAHAYLGASATERVANAFTGYAPEDSPALAELETTKTGAPMRPFPLINTALNLSGSPRSEWQQRKAASFMFSPLYCGYELPPSLSLRRNLQDCPQLAALEAPTRVLAHLKTADFLDGVRSRRLSQALAMTISGAAASPNMGYHTSPKLAALMTVFNVRLGWWMPNPASAQSWRQGGPNFSIWYLLRELAGNAHEGGDFVYVSDGGHFENLGVYELLRRRSKLIVASDASADDRFLFEDLANLVRKARVDLGVEIAVDALSIRAQSDASGVIGLSDTSFVAAEIFYPQQPGETTRESGWLVYVKSSLPKKLPADVENYRFSAPGFPHQSTADQWFDENQFESYRRLGLAVGRDLMLFLVSERPLAW